MIAAGMLLPMALFAADATTGGTSGSGPLDTSSVGNLIRSFTTNILGAIVTLLIGLGLVFFLWGVVKYVTAGADESKATEGRNLMIYGIISLAVMVSVWGLVKILTSTLNLTNEAPAVPSLAQ